MKKISVLLRNSVFFTFATFIEALAPFILAPFLTRYLSVYEYGVWAIFQSAVAFLRPVMGLALDDYIRIHFHRNDKLFIVQYIVAIFLLSVLLATVAIAAIIIAGGDISAFLLFPEGGLWTIVACAWLFALFYLGLTYHQFAGNHLMYSLIQFAQAAITIGATVMLIMGGAGWGGAVFGKIAGLTCGVLLAFGLMLRGLPKFKFQWHVIHFPKLLSFGLLYLPSSMLTILIMLIDRLMIGHMISVEAASLYSVASLFPMVLMIAIQGFMFGWQPWCFGRLAKPKDGSLREIALGAALYCTLLPLGGIILAYLCEWLGPWVIGASFRDAFDYVFILIMAMVVQGMYMLTQSILQYYQKIAALSWIALALIAGKLFLNYQMIPSQGIVGAGMALIVIYGLAFAVTLFIAIGLLRRHAGEVIVLRPVCLDDAELLLAWRNDPDTRRGSHRSEAVTSEEHQAWLAASLSNSNRKLYIGEKNGKPVGTVRADQTGGAWTISWTVAPEHRGKGIGRRMVAQLATQLGGAVRAEVKSDNAASRRIAEHAGLVLVREEAGVLYFQRNS
jgi:O-antigen/teichoic acid export membrane protein